MSRNVVPPLSTESHANSNICFPTFLSSGPLFILFDHIMCAKFSFSMFHCLSPSEKLKEILQAFLVQRPLNYDFSKTSDIRNSQ